jgi:DNA-binding PadR family transcriptional regulator
LAETDTRLNKNQIWQQLKGQQLGSEPTILYAIDDLQKWDMVKVVKTDRAVPGGNKFNYYTLTPSGVENLISAGIIHTRSISPSTVRSLLQRYQDLLPYAASVSDLWPIFRKEKVEDIAARRLARLFAECHGEQLCDCVVRGLERPRGGSHALLNRLREHQLGKKPLSLNCSAIDDLEVFVDPDAFLPLFDYLARSPNADVEFKRWLEVVTSNEKLQVIDDRRALKEAEVHMRKTNGILNRLAVKRSNLKDGDVETYTKLIAEVNSIRSKIVNLIPSGHQP